MFFGRQTACASLPMEKARLALQDDPSIHLIDVRTPEEYRAGHIPGSRNIPLGRIHQVAEMIPDRTAKLFVYCLSGGRSAGACAHLARMGYANAFNIGAITRWSGPIEAAQAVRR